MITHIELDGQVEWGPGWADAQREQMAERYLHEVHAAVAEEYPDAEIEWGTRGRTIIVSDDRGDPREEDDAETVIGEITGCIWERIGEEWSGS